MWRECNDQMEFSLRAILAYVTKTRQQLKLDPSDLLLMATLTRTVAGQGIADIVRRIFKEEFQL
jgi:hypothetical protein